MNTYDFDKTIYINDSSADFFLWCLKKYPSAGMRILPGLAGKGISYLLKCCTFLELKERIFSYLNYLPDVDRAVDSFWEEKWSGIGQWYLDRRRPDDVIISASPEFLLRPVGERLGVEIIATRMDSKTGRIFGKNCHDSEKIRRFYEMHPDAHVDEFYSDSDNDIPMARLADRAYRVTRGKLSPWSIK